MSGRIHIAYSLTGIGWSRTVVSVGRKRVEIRASYLSDALGDLVIGAALLAEGLGQVEFSWAEEPGEHRWQLTRMPDDKVRLRVRAFRGESATRGHTIIDTVQDRSELLHAVLDAAVEVRDEWGEQGYASRWHSNPFPTAAVERLRASLGALEPGVVEWYELIRAQRRHWFAEETLLPIDLLKHVLVDAMYELSAARSAVCFVDVYESSATVTDDGPGLQQTGIAGHDPLVALFGTLLTPQPDMRGSLAEVVALCSRFEVETVANGMGRRLCVRRGIVVDGSASFSPDRLDPSSFTRLTLEPDWTCFGVSPQWPTPLPDVVSKAAEVCDHRPWWRDSILDRVAVTDHRHRSLR